MSRIYSSADELIGSTPLLEVRNIEREEGLKARVLVKLEYFNPAGSVKDRPSSSSPPPATRASALRPWPPPGGIGSSSSCRRP